MSIVVQNKETQDILDGEQKRQTASAKVLQVLLNKIQNGEYTSGQRVSISDLEADGNRNAVREAMSQLVGWDILEYTPYCGYRMREYTLHDLLERYELREAIEPLAARRLARLRPRHALNEIAGHLAIMEDFFNYKDMNIFHRADLDFHYCIVANCGNRQFTQKQIHVNLIALFFLDHIQPFKMEYRQYSDVAPEEDFDELNIRSTNEMHRKIYDSICNGSVETAELLCRNHAATLVRNLENFILFHPELAHAGLADFNRALGKKKNTNKGTRKTRSSHREEVSKRNSSVV